MIIRIDKTLNIDEIAIGRCGTLGGDEYIELRLVSEGHTYVHRAYAKHHDYDDRYADLKIQDVDGVKVTTWSEPK
jgi:hypothetical protein